MIFSLKIVIFDIILEKRSIYGGNLLLFWQFLYAYSRRYFIYIYVCILEDIFNIGWNF